MDTATSDESVRRRMRRNAVEDGPQNPALHLPETFLGRFEQAVVRPDPIAVVLQRRRLRAQPPAGIGEPVEFGGGEADRLGDRGRARPLRDVELPAVAGYLVDDRLCPLDQRKFRQQPKDAVDAVDRRRGHEVVEPYRDPAGVRHSGFLEAEDEARPGPGSVDCHRSEATSDLGRQGRAGSHACDGAR
ncbi:hypothetical protein MLGJGCBP_03498 [Rhodococcus sp. T7]|nr:hypothetical protein MLGJGCBP_03498 [Rhodococcus sp. T7]